MRINNDKKGVELSMNLIIIAAIALLVLVIIAVLVLRGAGNVTTQTSCEAQGGTCYPSASPCPDGMSFYAASCPVKDTKCCITPV